MDINIPFELKGVFVFVSKAHSSSLDLPPTQDNQTIFEFTISEQGHWEHWSNKVRGLYVSPEC